MLYADIDVFLSIRTYNIHHLPIFSREIQKNEWKEILRNRGEGDAMDCGIKITAWD